MLEEYQSLLIAEKDCSQAVRDSEWEVAEILRSRVTQELNITLDMPYYDIVRIKAEESEEVRWRSSRAQGLHLTGLLLLSTYG